MKTLLFCLAAVPFAPLWAEETASSSELAELRKQVEALTQTVGTLQQQLDSQKQLWSGFNTPATSALAPSPGATEIETLRSDVEELKSAQQQTKSGMFNPDISAAIDFITSYSKSANQWNFALRNVEVMIQSDVDQYAHAYIILNAETELAPTERLAPFDSARIAVEEAAIETTSLPWGLQLKAGQFFADFTRLGKVHSHDLPFVDRPLSLDAVIGGEAVARGFELNWLPPAAHYFRLTGGLVDNIGAELPITGRLKHDEDEEAAAFADRVNRPFRSLMGYARAATLLEIGQKGVLHLGTDYAQSSTNKTTSTRRQIASADAKLEWQPDPAKYDRFEVGAETLWTKQSGRFSEEADEATRVTPYDSASAYGGYLYAQYRFGKQWEPGVRVDYTRASQFCLSDESLDRFTTDTWTYSTYLTFNLSEFNRLRLQVNYVNASNEIVPGKGRSDLQAFFQWTVILGAHKHPFMP